MNTDRNRLIRPVTISKLHPSPSVFISGLILLSLAACNKPSEQVWSTKSESMMGASADLSRPVLNASPNDGAAVLLADRRRAAIELLLQASESGDPLLRVHSIEALSLAPDDISDVVLRGLGDDNRAVRFAAAVTVGRLKLTQVATLVEPLLHDDSLSVQAAAIYALRRCGSDVNPTPLAAMLVSNDPEVKGNAALVVGELGDKSAVTMLQFSVGKGMRGVSAPRVKIVELQMAEALVKLGQRQQLEPIHAALYSPNEESELAALACQMCGRLRDASVAPDLSNIMRDSSQSARPAEVRMAAAMALAQIDPGRVRNFGGEVGSSAVSVTLLFAESEDYRLRAQAAMTLGVIGDVQTLPQLTRLMSDANPLVQVAAAGAILKFPMPSAATQG